MSTRTSGSSSASTWNIMSRAAFPLQYSAQFLKGFRAQREEMFTTVLLEPGRFPKACRAAVVRQSAEVTLKAK